MKRTIRNQTRQDFDRRVGRIDPAYMRGTLVKPTPHRPLPSLCLGFFWAYLVVVVAQNRTALETALSPALRDAVLMAVAAALLASLTLFATHLIRMFLRTGSARSNSRALLLGVGVALALTHIPEEVRSAAFAMLGQDAQAILLSAGSNVERHLPGVDFSAAVSVSSWGL
ncbi:hypothetical protein [Cognatishimia sp. F0-27]|uniref:hypothetical protein n=1 Tax=Cognatishimia sp. F0-27 TaxID=2816855 RepID=UPI001D0BFFF6|nr:hypothetical protein [Cognatishimia sp. F0-27]MCC1491903.1 hypothetical protein [Cognatishimia sp. F0-27]